MFVLTDLLCNFGNVIACKNKEKKREREGKIEIEAIIVKILL